MSVINNLFLDTIESSGLSRPSMELERNFLGLVLCACVLPAFTEEIVFRGTIAQSLYNHKSKLAAVAISGALFSIFHANPAQTLHQFVLGAFLTLLVFRSGSLWTSVIVHFFNNALVVALSYTPLGSDEFWNLKTNPNVALTLMIVGLIGFSLCVLLYVLTTKSSWQRVTQPIAETQDDGDDGDDELETAEDEANDGDKKPREDYAVEEQKLSNAPLLVGVLVCVALWIAQLLR